MNSKQEPSTLLDLLPLLSGGRVTVTAGGYPFLSIRSDEKEIDIDVSGAKMAGVSLSDVIKLEEGGESILTASERAAKKLSNLRWRLTLYDTGTQILTMGSGVSRLTARVRVNPLRLKRLLEALR
jgi:hypothetical protein